MQTQITQQSSEWHSEFISRFQYGYFITINSNRIEGLHRICVTTFEDFEARLRSIIHALNIFCLGRAYQRQDAQLQTLVSMEIGRANSRLHAHMYALHSSKLGRSALEVATRLRRKVVGSYGLPTAKDAIEVSEFSPLLAVNQGNKYFHKCSDYLQKKYRVNNCFIV